MNFMFVTLFNKIPLCIFKQNTLVNTVVKNGQAVSKTFFKKALPEQCHWNKSIAQDVRNKQGYTSVFFH